MDRLVGLLCSSIIFSILVSEGYSLGDLLQNPHRGLRRQQSILPPPRSSPRIGYTRYSDTSRYKEPQGTAKEPQSFEESLQGARKVISAGNKFGLDLMKHLITLNDNTIMAPVSLSVALGMLYFAAEGNTKTELARALHYNEFGLDAQSIKTPLQNLAGISKKLRPTGVSYETANFVFAQKDLNISQVYGETLNDLFGASVERVDFRDTAEALEKMNSAIANSTKNLIMRPIEKVNPLAKVVLTNAVYFKGFWKKPFSVKSLFDSTFLSDGVTETPVKMMYMRDSFLVKSLPEIDADAIQMPYDGELSVMLILLPKDPKGVNRMLQKLNVANLIDDLSSYKNESLDLHIPRFEVKGSYSFKQELLQLGMKDIFTPGKAKLPKIDPEGESVLDDVVHEAKIRVDERGTEAEAITTATIITYSSYPSFAVRHPFVFFVVHKQLGSIFFAGKILRMNQDAQPAKY